MDAYGFGYTTLHPQDFRAAGDESSERHEIASEARADWPPHVSEHSASEVDAAPLSETSN